MTISKNWLLILLVSFASVAVISQSAGDSNSNSTNQTTKKKKDNATIYLNNGSVIYGVLEQNADIIVIKTGDGNIFAYSKSDIQKIELNSKPTLSNGAYHQFGFGISRSQTEFNGSFKIVNGYQIASKMYFGIGLGIEGYYNQTYIPIVIDMEYHPFSHWDSQLYIGGNFGKLMLESDENNGWLGGLKLGFSHPLGNRVDICTTAGFRHGVIERENYNRPWDSIIGNSYRRYEINRLEIALGFIIK